MSRRAELIGACALLSTFTGCATVVRPGVDVIQTTGQSAVWGRTYEDASTGTRRIKPVGERDPLGVPDWKLSIRTTSGQPYAWALEGPLIQQVRRSEWPGVLSPIDEELADLRAARDAGFLSNDEFREVEAIVIDQGSRQYEVRDLYAPTAAPLSFSLRAQSESNAIRRYDRIDWLHDFFGPALGETGPIKASNRPPSSRPPLP